MRLRQRLVATCGIAAAIIGTACDFFTGPDPSISMTLSRTALSFNPASSETLLVKATRSEYSGTITLVVEGLPSGVSTTFDPPTIAAGSDSTFLIVTTSPSPAAGVATVTIRATGSGVSAQTATLQVTVSVPTTTQVNYPVCGAIPIWFAYQNEGSNLWTPIAGTGTNPVVFSWNSTTKMKYVRIFAISTTGGTEYDVLMNFVTVPDVQAIPPTCVDNVATKTVTGSFTGVGTDERAAAFMGIRTSLNNGNNSFTFSQPNRPLDLFGLRYTQPTTSDIVPSEVIIRRSENPTDGATMTALAFGTGAAVPVQNNTLAVTGLSGETMNVTQTFLTELGTSAQFLTRLGVVATSLALPGIPSTATSTSEVHRLLASSGTGGMTRTTEQNFRVPDNKTLAFGPLLNSATTSVVAGGPYPRFRAQLPSQAEYDAMYLTSFFQAGALRFVRLVATAGYFGSTPATWDTTLPDFTGSTGFDQEWMPKAGEITDITSTANNNTTIFFGARPTDGLVRRFASRTMPSMTTGSPAHTMFPEFEATPTEAQGRLPRF
jgi:hypothetical protein